MLKWSIKRWRRMRFPLKLMLVFLPLIALPSLSGIYLLTQSYIRTSQDVASEYATDLLALLSQKIDDRLHTYSQQSKHIISDPDLLRYIQTPTKTMYERLNLEGNVSTKLNFMWLSNDQNRFVRGIVITTDQHQFFYGTSENQHYGTDSLDYRQMLSQGRGAAVWFAPQSYSDRQSGFDAFRLGRVIRDNHFREIGFLTLVIDTQAIHDIFEQTKFKDVSLRLLTEDGQEMLSNGKVIDERVATLTFIQTNEQTNWQLAADLPLDPLYKPIRGVGQLSVIFTIISLLLALTVIQLMTFDLAIPIKKLMNNMKQGIAGVRPRELQRFRGAVEIVEMNDTFISVMYEIEQLIKRIVLEEEQKKQAEIRVLQNQLSPHFLYNTLNTIRWMAILQNQTNIKEMVDSLNQLLTYAVRDTGQPVTLSEELTALKSYVNIQQVRYQQFSFTTDIEPALEQARILKFLLQPLVENALLHGLVRSDRPGVISISARQEDAYMQITVSDNGAGMEAETLRDLTHALAAADAGQQHFGVYSVQERIMLHYGPPYGLSITSRPNEGTQVTLRLPLTDKLTNKEA